MCFLRDCTPNITQLLQKITPRQNAITIPVVLCSFPIGKIFNPDFQSEPIQSQQTTYFCFGSSVCSQMGPQKWRIFSVGARANEEVYVLNGIEPDGEEHDH